MAQPDPQFAVVVFAQGATTPGVVLGPFKKKDRAHAAAREHYETARVAAPRLIVVPMLPASHASADKITEVMAGG